MGENLLLIDDNGNVLKEVGVGYDSLNSAFVGGKAYAHHKTAKLYYLHDISGNITSVEQEGYFVGCPVLCSHFWQRFNNLKH